MVMDDRIFQLDREKKLSKKELYQKLLNMDANLLDHIDWEDREELRSVFYKHKEGYLEVHESREDGMCFHFHETKEKLIKSLENDGEEGSWEFYAAFDIKTNKKLNISKKVTVQIIEKGE